MGREFSRYLVATAVAFLVAAGTALAGSPTASQVASLTVDGKLSDWKDVQPQTSESEPKLTAVAQDGTYLYAYFTFSDLDLARRVLRGGAIVWVNTAGKHEDGYGLRFRGTESMQKAVDVAVAKASAAAAKAAAPETAAPQAAGQPQAGTADGQADSTRRRNRQSQTPRAPIGTLEVLRDGAVNELITTGSRENGPAAACRFADGAVTYELRVPLAEVGLPPASGTAGAESAIAVGFQMSGRTQADRQAARGRQGANRRRGGVPSPWTGAPAGSGEAQPEAEGESAEVRSSATPGGTQAQAGATGTAESRRSSYPTIWHDLAVTPPAPPAAAK